MYIFKKFKFIQSLMFVFMKDQNMRKSIPIHNNMNFVVVLRQIENRE